MKRIPTTIPELDQILEGGFPAASINILTGSPGTGKTLLAQQIMYGNAAPDRRVLYLTTVNEPMHKVMRYVQAFPFFDQEKIGDTVLYEDIGSSFEGSDATRIMQHIEALVRQESPAILIIDSFKALSDLAPNVPGFRRALYTLTGALTASGCTTFLLGEYEPGAIGVLPEFAIADGIIDLTNERRGIRTYRYLGVVKLRGSGYADGRHAVRITSKGMQVFPRFRTPPVPEAYVPSGKRIPTGVVDLDALMGGGLLEGSNTLVGGTTGLGKTLLGLTFALSQAKGGTSVVLASFQEDPNQLGQLAANLNGDFGALEASGRLRLVYVSPVELDLDEHVLRVVQAIEDVDARTVVIDSLSDLAEGAYDEERFLNFAYSLIQFLRDRGITSMMTYDIPQGVETGRASEGLSRLADNLIVLETTRKDDQVERKLRIVKTRGSGHDQDAHTLRLTADGMVLGSSDEPTT